MSKTNIDCLRNIIKELTVTNVAKQEEANEFLDAIAKELNESEDLIKDAEAEALDAQDQVQELEEEMELANVEELGLDILRWELDNGNLRIQQEMENFISSLKKKYIGVAA